MNAFWLDSFAQLTFISPFSRVGNAETHFTNHRSTDGAESNWKSPFPAQSNPNRKQSLRWQNLITISTNFLGFQIFSCHSVDLEKWKNTCFFLFLRKWYLTYVNVCWSRSECGRVGLVSARSSLERHGPFPGYYFHSDRLLWSLLNGSAVHTSP